MIGRFRHLSDERLHECALAAECGEPIDPRADDHLIDCAECARRYREFASFFETIRDDAAATTDAVFTGERLQSQHDSIMRRLELAGRSARVISFPGSSAAPGIRTASRVAPRWLAASAAAGLIVGVGVGGALMPSRLSSSATRMAVAPPARVAPAPVRVNAVAPAQSQDIDDAAFLSELEVALSRPHTRELLSFDNLTPHVREIGNRVR